MNHGDPEISPTATCLTCGYALRNLPSHNCPECGHKFDPTDSLSYADRQSSGSDTRLRAGRLTYELAKTTSLPLRVTSVLIALATVILVSEPRTWTSEAQSSRDALSTEVLFLFWLAIATMRSMLKQIARLRLRKLTAVTQWRKHFDANDLACVILFSVLFFPWPLRLRFELSRSALTAAVSRQQAAGTSDLNPQWIGLYYVHGVYLYNGGQVLLDVRSFGIDASSDGDRAGFLFEPTRSPNWLTPTRVGTLGQNWSVAFMSR